MKTRYSVVLESKVPLEQTDLTPARLLMEKRPLDHGVSETGNAKAPVRCRPSLSQTWPATHGRLGVPRFTDSVIERALLHQQTRWRQIRLFQRHFAFEHNTVTCLHRSPP